MDALSEHMWPANDGDHVWSPWKSLRGREGTSPATQYRTCVHPSCGATEERLAPNG